LLLGKNSGSDRDPATVEWLLNDILAIEREAVQAQFRDWAGAVMDAPGLGAAGLDWDAERQIDEAEVERWYAAFEKVSGLEAKTHEGRRAIYNDFMRAFFDWRGSR
jgi:hypothetical protein